MKRFFIPAFAFCLLFVLNACLYDTVIDGKTYADYTGSRWARYGFVKQKKMPMGALHTGFRIEPMPDSDWGVILPHQRPNYAVWGKWDLKDTKHTTIAIVSVTPVLTNMPEKVDLKKVAETWISKQTNERMKDIKYEFREGTRNGVPVLNVKATCRDTGTKPESIMHSNGFFCLTKDKRILSAFVSERSPDPKFQCKGENAEEFFRHLSW